MDEGITELIEHIVVVIKFNRKPKQRKNEENNIGKLQKIILFKKASFCCKDLVSLTFFTNKFNIIKILICPRCFGAV
jgi:hypothetical protein